MAEQATDFLDQIRYDIPSCLFCTIDIIKAIVVAGFYTW